MTQLGISLMDGIDVKSSQVTEALRSFASRLHVMIVECFTWQLELWSLAGILLEL